MSLCAHAQRGSSRRNFAAQLGLLAVFGFVCAPACTVTCTGIDSSQTSIPVELGVDVDLHDLIRVRTWIGEREYAYLSVGSGGTAVVWGTDRSGKTPVSFAETFELGDADLRAAWSTDSSWWVVGDAGTLMVTNNLGQRWESVELGTDADLHGITGLNARPIVVGDDFVAVRAPEGTWSEPPPPPEGWGQLRAVYSADGRVYAVGLGGVIWSTEDPGGDWSAEASGVESDLFAVGRLGEQYSSEGVEVGVAGAEGTLLVREDAGTWSLLPTELSVDLIDLDAQALLDAEGNIYTVSANRNYELNLVDSLPGARALTNESYYGWATVGEDGAATQPPDSVLCY